MQSLTHLLHLHSSSAALHASECYRRREKILIKGAHNRGTDSGKTIKQHLIQLKCNSSLFAETVIATTPNVFQIDRCSRSMRRCLARRR